MKIELSESEVSDLLVFLEHEKKYWSAFNFLPEDEHIKGNLCNGIDILLQKLESPKK